MGEEEEENEKEQDEEELNKQYSDWLCQVCEYESSEPTSLATSTMEGEHTLSGAGEGREEGEGEGEGEDTEQSASEPLSPDGATPTPAEGGQTMVGQLGRTLLVLLVQ